MDATTNTETWLKCNTGWCERLKARVTPQQCAENRKRAKTGFEPLYQPCVKCSGITPGQTKPKTKKKGRKGKMTKIYCQKCGEPAENAVRGLCGNCYQYLWSRGRGEEKKYQLKNAVKVGEEVKKQQKPVAEPGPVSEPDPEPEADPEPTQKEAVQGTTQEDDPLAGAERIITTKPPQAKLRKSKNSIDFNVSAMRKFQMHLYSHADFHRNNGRLYMHMHGKPDENSMKIGWKDHQASSSVTVSFHAIARKLEMTAPMYFNVLGTSREDVLELEQVQ